MMRHLLLGLVHLYRWTLSPLLTVLGGPGSGCRFIPSCSQYALEALRQHGAVRGSWLALRRLLRCHPWGGWGYDPVPRPKDFCSCSPVEAKDPVVYGSDHLVGGGANSASGGEAAAGLVKWPALGSGHSAAAASAVRRKLPGPKIMRASGAPPLS